MWTMDGRIVSEILLFLVLNDIRFVVSHAPWCPSCQNFNSTWHDFAKAMISKEIQVATIDINEYPSLSGRFRISVLPTIY